MVFWLGFSANPAVFKYYKVRPILEKDTNDIKMHLLFFIEIPFLQSLHGPSVFQTDIVNRKLDRVDYENALYGKCLGKERCVNEFEHRLLTVGEKLEASAYEIDKRLDKAIEIFKEIVQYKDSAKRALDCENKLHRFMRSNSIAAVKEDGSVFFSGKQYSGAGKIKEWSDIVSICV